MQRVFEYHINLDERGQFYADVRDNKDETVFEIHSDEETGEIEMIIDGFMAHTKDMVGLEDYLKDVGIMDEDDLLALAS